MDEAMDADEAAEQAMVARRDAVRRDQVAFLVGVLDVLDAYPVPRPQPAPGLAEPTVAPHRYGGRGTDIIFE